MESTSVNRGKRQTRKPKITQKSNLLIYDNIDTNYSCTSGTGKSEKNKTFYENNHLIEPVPVQKV